MRVYARQLQSHLPYLRRYARALTGATDRGDDLVTSCVEVAMMAPTRFGLDNDSRVPLYALLNLLFDEDGAEGAGGRPVPSPHPIERALSRLPEGERRVYLLVALEDLSLTEVGQVLHIAPAEAAQRLTTARNAVRNALTQRVLVVEDNPILALEIGTLVTDMGHVVCGTAANEREALELAEAERPTLALLDVRLADGDNGIAVARALRQQKALRTIFVTAFDDELLERDARHLGQVVRKPFTADAVRAAIARAVFMPTPVAAA
ncbi:response regulator [Azospirillum sp. TSO22-1]|uniref:PhyR family response regulator anti-anti-sigma factor n=1 Tax=Azospirillum sp. TSO22-1 TaxID=716789 RepID=UPI000D60795B|nr:response regulator [Azospirillum sp. TSO22-1]PWC56831.1 regulator [Azospirillum sp. TSO22-1]